MKKNYRMEMPDYSIEGPKETVLDVLGQLSETEIRATRLYYLIPKTFLCFSFEMKQRVETDVVNRMVRSLSK